MWKKIINQEVYIEGHIICKTTAADSFKTGEVESITLSSLLQEKWNNWKDYFAEQTERMTTEEPVYYLSSREGAHFKAESL